MAFFPCAVLTVLVVGCSTSRSSKSSIPNGETGTEERIITIYVGGEVIRPGMIELNIPFSVAHAILLAGGIERFERDQNRRALIIGRTGKKFFVRREDYMNSIVQDGDRIWIPWH